MKRFVALFALMVFLGVQFLFAQGRVITGAVTNADDGLGIPGVAVLIKGTTIGTFTDVDGKYSLTLTEGAKVLMYTMVGMKTVEMPIGQSNVMDVSMSVDVLGLDEVVVTALGQTRQKRALGYSVQDVGGDKLVTAREANIVNSLQGRIAGVQITSSSGNVRAGSRIVIRGMHTFTGNNQPLFVVDGVPIINSYSDIGAYGGIDYGNTSMDLNSSDIESISILKGANAAALYGSRAVNGVVLVTTKSGKGKPGGKGLGLSLETNWLWETPLRLAKFQNLYGQGADGEFEYVDGQGGGTYDNVDESWGPRMDGRMIAQFDSPYDPVTGVRTPTPWIAHPDNTRSLLVTGLNRTTTLAVQGSDEKANFRLSLSNQDVAGILPNTDLKKNTVTINAGTNVTRRLSISGMASYINNRSGNVAGGGYTSQNVFQSTMNWFGRQVDMQQLKDKWQEIDPVTGDFYNWNHNYHDNPYWVLYKSTNAQDRDRIMGNATLNYNLTDWLTLVAKIGNDFYAEHTFEKRAKTSNDFPKGAFGAYETTRNELNANAILTFHKDVTQDLNVITSVGAEYNHQNYNSQSTNVSELIVPDLYAVSNAAVAATTGYYESHQEIQSVFGSANIGYKNYLFLDVTGRNDWSSTLPIKNNSYFYPSVSLSYSPTEMLGIQSGILSYAKVRASYAEVGGAAGVYQLKGVYGSSTPFNGQPMLGYTNQLPPTSLKPQTKKSIELGAELKFMNGRLGIDATWYKENTIDQIIPLQISRVTGFTSTYINAGNIQNKGFELLLTATPVKKADFSWDITVNWATNKNLIKKLYGTMKYMYLYDGSWNNQIWAIKGEAYGDFMGYGIVKENADSIFYQDGTFAYIHYSGRPLIQPSGLYRKTTALTKLGNVMPDWTGGINNAFQYKNLSFSFLIDARWGGVQFSVTDWFGTQAGTLARTAAINDKGNNIRDDVADGGGIKAYGVYGRVDAVTGTTVYTDALGNDLAEGAEPVLNTTYAMAQDFYHDWWKKNNMSVYDASFVKLREVIIGYTFNKIAFMNKVGVRSLTLSLVGRNLLLLYSVIPDVDPENAFSAGNVQGVNSNPIPSTRSFGFDLKVSF